MAAIELPVVSGLPTEAKQRLLAVLARELLTASGLGIVSVTDATGELLVYPLPKDANAQADQAIRDADPMHLAELRRRGSNPHNAVPFADVMSLPPEPLPPSNQR